MRWTNHLGHGHTRARSIRSWGQAVKRTQFRGFADAEQALAADCQGIRSQMLKHVLADGLQTCTLWLHWADSAATPSCSITSSCHSRQQVCLDRTALENAGKASPWSCSRLAVCSRNACSSGATLRQCHKYDMPSGIDKQRQIVTHPLNTEYHCAVYPRFQGSCWEKPWQPTHGTLGQVLCTCDGKGTAADTAVDRLVRAMRIAVVAWSGNQPEAVADQVSQ